MLITAFVEESGEPIVAVEALDAPITPEDVEGLNGKSRALRDLLADVDLHTDQIAVVSENVATIAVHALHGVCNSTNDFPAAGMSLLEVIDALSARLLEARAWALAGLHELAFYDTDDIETDIDDDGDSIATDPGREAAGKLFAGQHYEGGKPYVDWPAVALPRTDLTKEG